MAESNEKLILELKAKGVNLTKAQLKKLDGAVDNTTKSFALMAVGIAGATAAMAGLGKAIQVGKEFEASMAKVGAISGANVTQLKALEKTARDLGATTAFTASEVAGLQTEFAKLGFTSSEINKVTKGTLSLAGATGTDLATAASVAGSTLRGFGLSVEETGRVTNVMAASFSKSALDMEKFSNSMTYVAPIAKMAGVDLEGTTAILGQLANAGIDGSMAGTALRKILLEAGKEGSKLAKRMGGPIKSFDDFKNKMKKLKDEGFDPMAEGADLVGARAITSFGILLDGVDSIDKLTESITNTNEAQAQYDIMMLTVQGSMDKMMSAFSELGITIFQMVDGPLKGAIDGMTAFVGWLDEEQLKSYSTGLGLVAAAYLAYKVQAIAASIATKGFTKALMKNPMGLVAIGAGLLIGKIIELTGVFDAAKESMDDLGEIGEPFEISPEINLDGVTDVPLGDILGESIGEPAIMDPAKAKERAEAWRKIQAQEYMSAYSEISNIIAEGEYEAAIQKQDARLYDLTLQQEQAIKELEIIKASETAKAKVKEAFDKKRLKIEKQIGMERLDQGIAFLKQFKGGEVAAARIQQYKAVVDGIAAVQKSYAQAGGFPTGVIPAALTAAFAASQVMAISKSIGEIQAAQYGMDQVVDKPTMILAGEAGAESVQITPLEGPNLEGPQGSGTNITLNISAPLVDDTVVDTIIPAINEAIRRGESIEI